MSVSVLRTDEEITRIYEKFVDTVYKVCFVLLKNTDETEDATQNVFIKFMREKKSFENDEHIKAWLIVTARNECLNMLKHWFRSKRSDSDVLSELSYNDDYEKGALLRCVLDLDEKFRIPIYLYYYEGYSTAEISEMLGIKHSTIRTYMVKGREKLRLILEEEKVWIKNN